MRFILFAIFPAMCCIIHGINEEKKSGSKNPIEFYRNLFRLKRKEHIAALENLLLMDSIEKQANMINIMLKTIVKTIHGAKDTLEKHEYKSGDPFPEKEEIKDALSMVLENTALFTDLIVRFPFIAKLELGNNADILKNTIIWARNICYGSGVYIDGHEKILESLGQEMGFDEPDPSYNNPFKQKPKVDPKTSEERLKEYEEKKRKEKMKEKKAKRQGGPKLSKSEL